MGQEVREWFFDDRGQLRSKMVREVGIPTPDYIKDGKAVYLIRESDFVKMFDPVQVQGQLSMNRSQVKKLARTIFTKWGAVQWLNSRDFRVAAWAVKRYAQYEGRCPTCGKHYERYL